MTPVPLGAFVTPLERLNAALPANPEHDGPFQADLRVVLGDANPAVGHWVDGGAVLAESEVPE